MANRDMDLMFEACGAKSPFEFCVEHPRKGLEKRCEHPFPFAVIGRNATNDLVFVHSEVSRRHAYVQLIDGRLFWVDLHSRTGIHRAEGPDGSGWSGPHQAVYIGPFVLRPGEIRRHDNVPEPMPAELPSPLDSYPPEHDSLPVVTLEFLNASKPDELTWRMNRVLALIGSAPECKVQLIDPRVSRFHASLLRTATGLWAVDLLGRGGIRVNDEPVRCGRLGDGDELLIGGIRIRIHSSVPAASCISTTTAVESEVENTLVVQAPTTHQAAIPELIGIGSTGMSLSTDSSLPSLSENNLLRAGSLRVNHNPVLSVVGRMPAEMEVVDLGSLLLQFSKMQQQMSEQFQQAVMTIAEMFRSLHQDQMDLIREELDRLHELNDELRSIQVELATQNHRRVPGPSLAQNAVVRIEGGNGAGRKQAALKQTCEADRTNTAPESERTVLRKFPAQQEGFEPPQAPLKVSELGDLQSPKSSGPAPAAEDIHAWLCQRMAKIQDEQQSVWQRILSRIRSQVPG